ncbi:sugar phosphate isomerase/epimerase family protein [Aspergillus undulatus]|uniref:sugar phosphate isomerase/epimerase family protein n=1 Tax=Aspergillus undulatus TaxID=1810928 RepID=UPI003CCD450E
MTLTNKIAIGTSCLGQSLIHNLSDKIHSAASAGFQGLEIVYGDLERYCTSRNVSMVTAAQQIRQLVDNLGLEILSLAPFENFEGNTKTPLTERLKIASHWLDLARILGAPYLQIPSQYDANNSTTDESVIVSEMQQLSDLAASSSPVIKLAYEPLSWGVVYSTWDDALRLVNLVNRDDFGLCVDTFHELTKLWASSFEKSGVYPDGPERLSSSLWRFVETIPIEKVFYVQLSDAERFDPPFSKSHEWYIEGEAPEFTWSKHARPFPLEKEFGAYTPVLDVVRAWIVEAGFKGWVSMEIFDWRMRDADYGIGTAAERGWKSWGMVKEGAGVHGGDGNVKLQL